MHPIQIKLIKFLTEAIDEPQEIEDKLIDEFGERCKALLRKHFTEKRSKKFTIRMSNMGKPTCQLQMEKMGVTPEPMAYSQKVKFIYGDLLEALVMFFLKASGVQIQAEQVKVDLSIGGTVIDGTLDVEIDDAVYDLKSVSDFSYSSKFGPTGGIKAISDGDEFGYVGQLFGYGRAYEKPVGGWIAINKETGEIHVTEPGPSEQELGEQQLQRVDVSIRRLLANDEFKRCFQASPEVFRKKPTGNRILTSPCTFCPFKFNCWPGLEYRPQIVSESETPRWVYYTYIDDKYKEKHEDLSISAEVQ